LPNAAIRSSLSASLLHDSFDVVHICTPPETHESLAIEALAAGRHVLVEKPLALSAASTDQLLDVAARSGLLLCPVHQYLFQKGTARTIRLLPSLGTLRHISVLMCSAGGTGATGAGKDRIMFDILPHPLSVIARLLPTSLLAVEWATVHPKPGELFVAGSTSDCTIGIVVSLAGRPRRNEMAVIGEAGTAVLDFYHGYALLLKAGAASRLQKLAHPFRVSLRHVTEATINIVRRAIAMERAYPGLRALVADFYRAVRGAGPMPIAPEETSNIAWACERIMASVTQPAGEFGGSKESRP
jgi:predicted dehydrogenase